MADKGGYIGRNPGDSAVIIARQNYTPTGIQTDFTFNSGYTPGYVDVCINGALNYGIKFELRLSPKIGELFKRKMAIFLPVAPRLLGFDQGPEMDLRFQKTKRCGPKNHAEPRLQNSKWSHMVQVMAQNHFAPLVLKNLFSQGTWGADGAQLEQGTYL